MRAKEFLKQLSLLDTLIKSKIEEIHRLRDLSVSITINYESERVSSSFVGNPVGESVVRFMSFEEELKEELEEMEIRRKRVLKVLEQLPTAEYQVLREIYVKRRTYYEIMDDLDRSMSWVKNHHSSGLKMVQKILDEEEEQWRFQEPRRPKSQEN